MKHICTECNWHGDSHETLRAKNPWDTDDIILGCPRCKSVNSMSVACDEPVCWEPVTCGTPTLNGYRSTCGKHVPRKNEKLPEQDEESDRWAHYNRER